MPNGLLFVQRFSDHFTTFLGQYYIYVELFKTASQLKCTHWLKKWLGRLNATDDSDILAPQSASNGLSINRSLIDLASLRLGCFTSKAFTKYETVRNYFEMLDWKIGPRASWNLFLWRGIEDVFSSAFQECVRQLEMITRWSDFYDHTAWIIHAKCNCFRLWTIQCGWIKGYQVSAWPKRNKCSPKLSFTPGVALLVVKCIQYTIWWQFGGFEHLIWVKCCSWKW